MLKDAHYSEHGRYIGFATILLANMTLLSLYQKYIQLVAYFLQKADKAVRWDVRDSFRSQALACQTRAGQIAHCVALFGDRRLDTLNIPELLKQVEDKQCIQQNPWTRGLDVIERELVGQLSLSAFL